jgi:hypothetical protein
MAEETNIVVTGASTGIGRACVAHAVAQGARVFASVRKRQDADALIADFGDAVAPLIFDVTEGTAVRAAAAQVGAMLAGQTLSGLVNNAGVAVAGPLLEMDGEALRSQFDVNFFGVHTVTQAFAPLLGADPDRDGPPGRIVMISSVAGENGAPFLGAYAASKHAIEGYSQSLRRELMLFGIDVVVIGPGAIATPIWDKADDIDVDRYRNSPFFDALNAVRDYMLERGRDGLPPEDVGALVWHALTSENPKARYAILRNALMDRTVPRLLPTRVVDRMIARRLGLAPKQ